MLIPDPELIKFTKDNNYDMVKRLLELGMYCNVCDYRFDTALSWSSYIGHYTITELLLLQKKCKINNIGYEGRTPLIETAYAYNNEIMKLLIKYGCDINFQDKRGNTALMVCSFNDNFLGVLYLLENNCDLFLENKNSRSAYDMAYDTNIKKTLYNECLTQIRNYFKNIKEIHLCDIILRYII